MNNSFFAEVAWWNMLEADKANLEKATDPKEKEAFSRAAMRDYAQYLCYSTLYWGTK